MCLGRHPLAIDFLLLLIAYRIFDQQTKSPPGKFKTLLTIFRKVVNSFSIIPLILDQENGYLIYFVINEEDKRRKF